MGKGSVSSFLTGLLNVGWYAAAFGLALTALLVVLSLFVEVPGSTMTVSAVPPGLDVTVSAVPPGLDVTVSAIPPGLDVTPPVVEVPGLKMTIPVSFSVDARTHRVTAPSLGIEGAQIQDVRGSLRFPIRRGAFFVGNAILLIGYYAMTHFSADGLRFDARLEINGFTILHGLIILVIAEVFRTGTRLDEDQSLTV